MTGRKTAISLSQILNLVGKLDDSRGIETPRERFRAFLKDNVQEVGQIRDYIQECLRLTGDQYSRALQDLVNHLGSLLDFEVQFGRYHGVRGEIGFDGHWKSPSGYHIVVEVKTTEAYTVKTSTLVGYVDELISGKKIPAWDNALGLYVVGKPDPEISHACITHFTGAHTLICDRVHYIIGRVFTKNNRQDGFQRILSFYLCAFY